MWGWIERGLANLKELNAELGEAYERRQLLDRPWEEDFVHWSFDGENWHLHGTLTPPADGRRRSVTRGGWCPGRAMPMNSAAEV